MPYTPPTVNYATTLEGTYTNLTGVQSINIARGRQYFQDNFPQSSCVIELIPATSYATPLAIGQFIDVRDANSGTSPCYFSGRITDVQRTYAIPYNSGTGYAPGDRIVITASGGTGVLGSGQLSGYTPSATGYSQKIQQIVEQFEVFYFSALDSIADASSFTVNSSALDAVNGLLRTGQAMLDDLDLRRTIELAYSDAIFVIQIGKNFGLNYAFADTGSPQRYKSIEYQSSAQTVFNRVQVEPEGLATQTVSGTGTYNTLVYNTFNATTGDAASLASYLYSLLSGQLTPVPFRIGTDTTVAASCMDLVKLANVANKKCAISQEATITFRGSTVTGIIQGFNATFDIDKASLVVYLSPSLGQPFTLDSTSFGVLDTNRLGYP